MGRFICWPPLFRAIGTLKETPTMLPTTGHGPAAVKREPRPAR